MSPDVFLHAAELIDSGQIRFCCSALGCAAHHAGRRENGAELRLFIDYFLPEDGHVHTPWFGVEGHPHQQSARVFALLFAAEIAEDSLT